MAEFLFEIFCEEIPARMQVRAGADLSKALTDGLTKAGLSVENSQILTGPRRLTFVADIPLQSPDVSEERKGPRVGAPEQALGGFMKAAGLSDITEAQVRSDKKGKFYVAVIEKSGQASSDIISTLIPDIMNNFPWPKSMKSGDSTFRWVRPLQGLLCLLDGDVVPFEAGGVSSGNQTEGHRRHGRGPFTISNFAEYKSTLEKEGHVILSAQDRKDLIEKQSRALCKDKGLEWVEDPGLLDEVSGLAEWPVVILGDMDPGFLELPGEVIRLSMRTHQKYFAVRDPKTGTLAPHFIVVANQIAPDGGKAIAEGNSRVLSARLSDAQFFQAEDAKKTLGDYYDKLDSVVFHKKLGSIQDKAQRITMLSRGLAPIVGADLKKCEQAAKLAKCDLVTQTVIEFTSLQGQIGRLMFEKEGGDPDVAMAIEDHYRPQGPSDTIPKQSVGTVISLADKFDSLLSFWAINEKPTGSKDPYALRRAALGAVRVILENDIRLNLSSELLKGWAVLEMDNMSNSAAPENLTDGVVTSDERAIIQNLIAFIADRLKVHLRDEGVRHDLIDAVFALGENDLVAIVNRVKALQGFLGTDDGENLLSGYKRAANIIKAERKKDTLAADLFETDAESGTQKEETALFNALAKATPSIESALESEDFAGAMTALSKLRAPIDAFFDHVTVNSDIESERQNRLRLLGQIRDTARKIADFERIDG